MKNLLFIAWQDVRNQLREGSTLLWLFVMPPIFFYFIGTVTSGFSSGVGGGQATPLTVVRLLSNSTRSSPSLIVSNALMKNVSSPLSPYSPISAVLWFTSK